MDEISDLERKILNLGLALANEEGLSPIEEFQAVARAIVVDKDRNGNIEVRVAGNSVESLPALVRSIQFIQIANTALVLGNDGNLLPLVFDDLKQKLIATQIEVIGHIFSDNGLGGSRSIGEFMRNLLSMARTREEAKYMIRAFGSVAVVGTLHLVHTILETAGLDNEPVFEIMNAISNGDFSALENLIQEGSSEGADASFQVAVAVYQALQQPGRNLDGLSRLLTSSGGNLNLDPRVVALIQGIVAANREITGEVVSMGALIIGEMGLSSFDDLTDEEKAKLLKGSEESRPQLDQLIRTLENHVETLEEILVLQDDEPIGRIEMVEQAKPLFAKVEVGQAGKYVLTEEVVTIMNDFIDAVARRDSNHSALRTQAVTAINRSFADTNFWLKENKFRPFERAHDLSLFIEEIRRQAEEAENESDAYSQLLDLLQWLPTGTNEFCRKISASKNQAKFLIAGLTEEIQASLEKLRSSQDID